jgi:phosphoribosyl 1,2-cyclic phosphate phosphodiesterase
VLFQFPAGNLLVDTTPEMRLQLLRERVRRVDAIVYTHSHVDHLFGFDDARLFPKYLGGPLPIFCDAEVEHSIRRVFNYAFHERAAEIPPGHLPKVRFERIEAGTPFEVLGQSLLPVHLEHGRFNVLGFRVGGLAYCTDVSKIPEATWPRLEGLDVLILDALRYDPHPTHFSLSQALDVIAALKPKRAILTHLSHSFDHGPTETTLPPHVGLAYDGLAVEF